MKAPRRWSDDGAPDDDVRAMLSNARRSAPMTGADRARLRRRVRTAMTAPALLAMSLWSKLLLAAAGVSVASWVAITVAKTSTKPRAESRAANAPRTRVARGAPRSARTSFQAPLPAQPTPTPTPSAPTLSMSPPPSTTPTAPITPTTPPRRRTMTSMFRPVPSPALVDAEPASTVTTTHEQRSTAVDSSSASSRSVAESTATTTTVAPALAPLAREAHLLEQARAALQSDPQLALQRAREASAEFPSGQLREERAVVEIEALLRLHRRSDAIESARHMLASDPDSAYAPRWRALVGSDAR